jgi:hypothetical protein
MNIDITEKVFKFREAARNLWNIYLREGSDWDTVDVFNGICSELFQEIVLRSFSNSIKAIELEATSVPLQSYSILAGGVSRLPLLANREIPATGYWDHPIEWISSDADLEIKPICFFDFDSTGWRDLEYLRVKIISCPSMPELEGREALIECRYLKIELIQNA